MHNNKNCMVNSRIVPPLSPNQALLSKWLLPKSNNKFVIYVNNCSSFEVDRRMRIMKISTGDVEVAVTPPHPYHHIDTTHHYHHTAPIITTTLPHLLTFPSLLSLYTTVTVETYLSKHFTKNLLPPPRGVTNWPCSMMKSSRPK